MEEYNEYSGRRRKIIREAIHSALPDAAVASALQAEKGVLVEEVLKNNDSYHALKESGGLIITGPTGTNVNDISVLLIKR